MNEIKCPHCGQYWYGDDEVSGRGRLCARCRDELRRRRGDRAPIDVAFLIGVAAFLVVDLLLIALTAIRPAVFGKVMLVVGCTLLLVGLVSFRVARQGGLWTGGEEIDWTIGRWSLLIGLSGLACLLAYGPFVGFSHGSPFFLRG